jgi:type VI secretion system protein ImpC
MADQPSRPEIRPAARPRIKMNYQLEFTQVTIDRELPFVIGVLADLSGNAHPPLPPLRGRKFIQVDRDNFDGVFAALAPGLHLEVSNVLGRGEARLAVDLRFKNLSDFEPPAVAIQVAPLRHSFDYRRRLLHLQKRAESGAELPSLIGEAGEIAAAVETTPPDLRNNTRLNLWLDAVIATLDGRISGQLDEIYHNPQFQTLESAWRGLHYLVSQTAAFDAVRVRVLNCSKRELLKDMLRVVEISQSQVCKKIYGEEFDVFGGSPYAILIGDFELDAHLQEDIFLLERISELGAMAHAPFIAAASPAMFGCDNFVGLASVGNLTGIFQQDAWSRWRSFRERESARYAGLIFPRMLMRSPHRGGLSPGSGSHYEERSDRGDGQTSLWGNSGYAFGVLAGTTHSLEGWCAGLGLPSAAASAAIPAPFVSMEAAHPVTEIRIDESLGNECAGLGLIPFVTGKDSHPVFMDPVSCAIWSSAPSCPSHSAALRSVLAISRLAHYIKSMVRDTRGCFTSRKAREEFYNAWIRRYVASEVSDEGSSVLLPLKSAKMEVLDYSTGHDLNPGEYRAVASLVLRMPSEPAEDLSLPARIVVSWADL